MNKIERIEERENRFKENNYYGPNKGEHKLEFIKGEKKILLCALHSVKTLMKPKGAEIEEKKAHSYTGAITEDAGRSISSCTVTRLGYGDYIKPSQSYGEIYDFINENGILYLADMIGFSSKKPKDIYIGLGGYLSNIKDYEEIQDYIEKILGKELGASLSYTSYEASGLATLAGNVRHNIGIPTTQFYVSKKYRDFKNDSHNACKFVGVYELLMSEINCLLTRRLK